MYKQDMDTTTDNDYFELEPYDQYKPQEAKFSSSLKWLLSKAYANQAVPSHLNEPFFEENELGKSLRNEIVTELIGGKIYCRACEHVVSTTLSNTVHKFTDIAHVFEYLLKNSIQVTDENDDSVSYQSIQNDSPFYVSAHIALIDCLMTVYSSKILTIENVAKSLKKFSAFNPSEIGSDTSLEVTAKLWLNRIIQAVLKTVQNECELYSKQSSLGSCQQHLHINQIDDDLSGSLSNGTILNTLVVFYTCDADIDLSDICLQETVGFEESVENLNLLKEFCDKFISSKPFCFNFEDFLYSPISMNINKLAFIAELFYWFEMRPVPDLISANHFELFKEYIKKFTKRHFHATTPFISSRIGDVTRNSFIKGSFNPPVSASAAVKSNNNESSSSPKLQASTQSFNSLLDNVALDVSQTFENDTTTSTNNTRNDKISNNNNNNNNLNLDLSNDNEDRKDAMNSNKTNTSNNNNNNISSNAVDEQEQIINPLFSSRTYVKASSSSSAQSRLGHGAENEKKNDRVDSVITTSNANSSKINLSNIVITGNNSDSVNSDIGMKTVRLNHSSINTNLLPNIMNNLNVNPSAMSPTTPPVNSNNNKPPGSSSFYSASSSMSTVTNVTPTPPTAVAASGTAATTNGSFGDNDNSSQSGGLVRRLSVTARPGDIFYKVKDVTETSSSTDAPPHTDNIEQEIIIKTASSHNNNSFYKQPSEVNNKSNIENKNNATPQPPPTGNGTNGRKTTTWNVKRNQTTSLGISSSNGVVAQQQQQHSAITTHSTSKDDFSLDSLITQKEASLSAASPSVSSGDQANVNPRELLSIRMQLKEKKSIMERDKRKQEAELDRQLTSQRQTIGKQVFLQVVQQKSQQQLDNSSNDQHNDMKQTGSMKDSTPRRQWDKSQAQHKNLINEMESSSSTNKNVEMQRNHNANNTSSNGIASSTSSMSTPSSSASQSPPISNQAKPNTQIDMAMSVDLNKAYFSRDEMIRAIESLKSKYVKEAMNVSATSTGNATVNRAANQTNVNSIMMVKEIEALNSKLAELQNEINRLTLAQHNEPSASPVSLNTHAANNNNSNNTTADTSHFNSNSSFVLSEERGRHLNNSMNDNNQDQQIPFSNQPNSTTAPPQQPEGPFFISIGSGSAKREKPALTSKKNQIFVKTANEESNSNNKTATSKISQANTNLLMAAAKSNFLPPTSDNNSGPGISYLNGSLMEDQNDGDNSSENSGNNNNNPEDDESAEIKQRRREMIIARQMERRQQQELIRQKREEERMRKAEEIRMRDEEAAQKKQLEKTRKETIFQAYIEKKKQAQDECSAAYFGPPNSTLINARRYHSTLRLKQQQQNKEQQFDQFSVGVNSALMSPLATADRSMNAELSTGNLMKTSTTIANMSDLHQANSSSSPKSSSSIGSSPYNTYVRKRPTQMMPTIPSSMSMHTNLKANSNKSSNNNNNNTNGSTSPSNNDSSFANATSSNNNTSNYDSEYSGPKLYKRLTGKTNKSTIINSLNQLVLAGVVNAQLRKQVIEEIEASDARHFVILFRDYHLQYRGVYSYTSETDYIEKVVGQGPQRISEDMIEKYYKYNSGGKQFSPVPTKHFSVQCDAVTIHSVYWASRKSSQPVSNVSMINNNTASTPTTNGTTGGFMPQSAGNTSSNNSNTLRR